MPAVKPPPYPKSLTVDSWNKAKGLIARILQIKTGITEELKKADKLFNAAPFADVNIAPLLQKKLDLAALKKAQDDYLRKYHPIFKKLEGDFHDLSSFLTKKAQEFEKNDTLKKFAPVVKIMASDANKFTYAVAWGTVSSENQAYLQKAINDAEKAEKQWAEAAQGLKNMIDKACKAVDKYKSKTPSLNEYKKLWQEELRGIGAQIAMASRADPTIKDKFVGPSKKAAKQWAQTALPTKEEEVAEQIKKDLLLLREFKKISDGM
jgi:hypothetical protein